MCRDVTDDVWMTEVLLQLSLYGFGCVRFAQRAVSVRLRVSDLELSLPGRLLSLRRRFLLQTRPQGFETAQSILNAFAK